MHTLSSPMISCLLHRKTSEDEERLCKNFHAKFIVSEGMKPVRRCTIHLWRDPFDRSKSLMKWFDTGSSCTLIVQLFENSFRALTLYQLRALHLCISERTKKVLIKTETHKGPLIKGRIWGKRNIHKLLTFTFEWNRGVHKPKYMVFAYGMVYLLIGFLQVNSMREEALHNALRTLDRWCKFSIGGGGLLDLRRSVWISVKFSYEHRCYLSIKGN